MRFGRTATFIAFGAGVCAGYALDEFSRTGTVAKSYFTAKDVMASAAARDRSNGRQLLYLELGYIYEIVVPRGSELKVTVEDAAGKMVGEREMKTELDSPPYLIEVPLKPSPAYPITVHATLKSVLGHEFSETRQIGGAQVASADFVPIEMK
jgi:hypothetical protein